jgi:hypothetical protein
LQLLSEASLTVELWDCYNIGMSVAPGNLKNAASAGLAVLLLLGIYIGCYFWTVRPVEVVWFQGKHVPRYRWGNKSKPAFAALVWIDTQIRPEYWHKNLDTDPSW